MEKKRTNKIIIPAYKFKAQSLGDGLIQEYVNDSLRVIQDDLNTALENEKTFIKTELPVQFDIHGMDNIRAQRHVYYHLLKALKSAGYIPRLEINNLGNAQKVHIHITWLTKEDREQEEYMDKFVAAHMLRPTVHQAAPLTLRKRAVKK